MNTNYESKIKNSGFTLIELLVVMMIIGILASLSFFGLQGAREAGRDTKRKTDLEAIRGAVEAFRSDCNSYPASLTFGASLTGATCSPSNGNTYMTVVPADPQSPTRSYCYSVSGATYTLCARLEQGGSGACSCSCGSGGACNYRTTNP